MPWYVAAYLINFIWLNTTAYHLAKRPRRWLWRVFAVLACTLLALSLLIGCKPKAKIAAPTIAPPAPTVDSVRIDLQNRADTSRSRADRATNASNAAVTDYETDLKTYDALRNPLP